MRSFIILFSGLASALLCPVLLCADDNSINREIPIGGIFSLSSYGASYGQPEANASIMAVEEINQAGGVRGKKLRLILEDNQTSTKETANALNRLINIEKVVAVLGPNWAEFSEVAAPIVEAQKVVLLTASGWTRSLTLGRKYVFTTLPSHPDIVEPLAKYIAGEGIEEITIANNPNAYLESVTHSLKERLESHGVKVRQIYTSDIGVYNYRPFLSKLKREKVPAVLLALLQTGENVAFLKQARELEFKGRIFGTNNVFDSKQLEENLQLANGVVAFDYDYLRKDPSGFRKKYRKRFGSDAIVGAPRAYDNVYLLRNAIEKCGEARAEIRKCLALTDFHGVTGRIRFNASNNVIDVVGISNLEKVENGIRVPIG